MIKSRIDTIEIQSRNLGKTMAVTIYVPTNFCEGLPVLYFMHGRSGDESIIHALDIQTVADRKIVSRMCATGRKIGSPWRSGSESFKRRTSYH